MKKKNAAVPSLQLELSSASLTEINNRALNLQFAYPECKVVVYKVGGGFKVLVLSDY